MIELFGIPNCDKVRAARKWLEQSNIEYTFRNIREDTLNKKQLKKWCTTLGWEELLNRRSTSWRALPETNKQDIDQDKAIALIIENPTLMKRPLLVYGQQLQVGFDKAQYQKIFKS